MGPDHGIDLSGPVALIAVDSNILIYALRSDSPWHGPADACLTELAESGQRFAIPWPCVHEFLNVVTHPRIYGPPTPAEEAIAEVERWMKAPALMLLREEGDYWSRLRRLIVDGRAVGPRVHDARIAALCLSHGVRELWSADRDFSRFPALRVRNPLVGRGQSVRG